MERYSEQAENLKFFRQLDICCRKVAEQIGTKPISEWTNSNYIKLSAQLSRRTKIHLSESTLKRIFGKNKTSTRYYPQKATRDALAQFIGHRDWTEFELLNPLSDEQDLPSEEAIQDDKHHKPKPEPQRKWLLFSTFLTLACMIAIVATWQPSGYNLKNIRLHCVNPIGFTPHSAIFSLDVRGALPDSSTNFSIDFGDGKIKRSKFTDSLVNYYYEVPGRYYPLLYYKDRIIDTGSVYLQTKGWTATGSNQQDTTRVFPIPAINLANQGTISASAKEIQEAGVDTSHTFFVAFTNIKPSNIDGDNFELNAELRTSASRAGIRCSQVDISIYGETDLHSFGIIKPECVAWTQYKFSENYKSGRKYDLRPLGYDLSHGGHLYLKIRDKKVSLFINGNQKFETQYKKPIGKIMGIKISFAGLGTFKNLELTDLHTRKKY